MINFCKNKLKNYSLIYGKEQTIYITGQVWNY
jgi:hypothetical protein